MATGFHPAEIVARRDVSAHLMILTVRPPEPMAFIPGQFLRLGLEQEGKLLQRSYTIASAPHEPLMEFLFELVPDGKFTPLVWDLREGDTLLMHTRTAGVFVLSARPGFPHHLMAATVTGIAPFASIIRSLSVDLSPLAKDSRLLLLHSASNASAFGPYLDEIKAAEKSLPLTYVPTIVNAEEDWRGEIGELEDVLRKHADAQGMSPANTIGYLSGHPLMIENARAILRRARFEKKQVLEEKFFALKKSEV